MEAITGMAEGGGLRTADGVGRASSANGQFALPQALRGVAALWVVLFHLHAGGHVPALFARAPAAIIWIFEAGSNGVAIFFPLSGFVIAHSLRAIHPSMRLLGRFVLRRSIRLDPPYWAAILTALMVEYVQYRLSGGPAPAVTLAQVAAHLVYAQTLLGFENINIVFWTLCYEVQFYIFLVASLVLSARLGGRGASAILLVHFGVACLWLSGYQPAALPGLFVDRWYAFYLGVLAYRAPASRLAIAQMVVLAILIALRPSAFAWVSLGTATLLAGSLATGFVDKGLRTAPLLFLGTISYSLYLFHNPVTGTGFFVARLLHMPDVPALLMVLGANVLAAWIAYRVVEAPTHAISRRIRLR